MSGEFPIIEEALDEILEELRSLPSSPAVREMRAHATKYQRVVKQWSHAPPTPAQSAAMLECVMELHVKVRGRVTARPPASWRPSEDTKRTIPPEEARSTKRPSARAGKPAS